MKELKKCKTYEQCWNSEFWPVGLECWMMEVASLISSATEIYLYRNRKKYIDSD